MSLKRNSASLIGGGLLGGNQLTGGGGGANEKATSILASHSGNGRREYLIGDEVEDETEYSGFTVSSVGEDVPSIIAPSTKLLRFPMKQDQSQVLEIRYIEPEYIQKEPPPDCCCCYSLSCISSIKRAVTCQCLKKLDPHEGGGGDGGGSDNGDSSVIATT